MAVICRAFSLHESKGLPIGRPVADLKTERYPACEIAKIICYYSIYAYQIPNILIDIYYTTILLYDVLAFVCIAIHEYIEKIGRSWIISELILMQCT